MLSLAHDNDKQFVINEYKKSRWAEKEERMGKRYKKREKKTLLEEQTVRMKEAEREW